MALETLVEVAVLLLATWPVLRFLSIPSVRREYRGIALLLTVCVAIYSITVIVIAACSPALLRLAAIVGGIGLLAERWRARVRYGARSGLPPGSLGLFPRRPWVDDLFYAKQMGRHGSIFKVSLLYRPMVCVHGAELGRELMREHEVDLETLPVRFNRFIPRGFLRYMAPDDHRKYRKLLQAAISQSCLRAAEPELAVTTRAALAEMVAERGEQGLGGAHPRAELGRLFFGQLVRLFLGVNREQAEYTRLEGLYRDLEIRKMSLIPAHRDRQALTGIMDLIRQVAVPLPGDSGAGTSSGCVLTDLLRAEPEGLADDTLLANLVYVIHIGRTDLTSLGVWTLKLLADHREWWERLVVAVGEAEPAVFRSLASRIVKECLRLEQSEYLYRRARRPIRFRGYVIPAGWRLRVLVREGHRDDRFFDAPESFDPDRFVDDAAMGGRYTPFGLGTHSCLGPHVTDVAMSAFLIELATGFDWRAVADGPREYGWAHWQPSSRFRIELVRRG